MALFNQLSREEIKEQFTHKGLWLGIVPCYIGDHESDAPLVEPRNWVPEFLFDTVTAIYGAFIWISTAINEEHEPGFFFKITGEIK